MKYERYYPDHQTRKVFNDILGLRAFCDSYDQILEGKSSQFRIADMSNGKAVDDGYRLSLIHISRVCMCVWGGVKARYEK